MTVKNELERMWKDAVVEYNIICLVELMKNIRTLELVSAPPRFERDTFQTKSKA